MKIAALTFGGLTTASTWYRLGQYLPYFALKNWKVDFFRKGEIPFGYDLVIVQKVLPSPRQIKKILASSKRVFFDFDDAIWTRPGKDFNFWIRRRVAKRLRTWCIGAEKVIVPNQFLADKVRELGRESTVIPMAIDLTSYPLRHTNPPPVMGWSGAPHNLTYLNRILPALKEVEGKLAIYSGQSPTFDRPFEHIPFTQGGESHFLQQVGIGLLPLPEDPYAKGKSPIKALQYMAAGIPFVYEGRGGVEDLVHPDFAFRAETTDEWITHLNRLMQDPTLRFRAGQAARAFAEKHHDVSSLQEKFFSLI